MASILRKNMYGYLFVDVICAKQFSESEVRRKCKLRETGNVQGQIHEHIFARNGGSCVYYPSNVSATGAREKNVAEKLTVSCARCSLFSVLWYNFLSKKRAVFFFCNNRNTLSHLELNIKRKLPPGLEL